MKPFYSDEWVTLYHGDARDILPRIGQADVVITDVPSRGDEDAGADLLSPDMAEDEAASLALQFARRWAVAICGLAELGACLRRAQREHGGWTCAGFVRRMEPSFMGDTPRNPGYGLAIMHKPNLRKHWNGRGHRAIWEAQGIRQAERLNPQQRAEPLMDELVVDFTAPGETVLDMFAGSGTTLVAAKRLGRRAVGIEIDRQQCDHAVRRLSQLALPLQWSLLEG